MKKVFLWPGFVGVMAMLLFLPLFALPVFSDEGEPPQVVENTNVNIDADTGEDIADIVEQDGVTTAENSTNVTLDFKETDILLVLRLLSLKSGINIVAGPEVTGTVTIRLNDVPWDKALDVVLKTYGYVYERDGNIIRVTTRENLESEDLVTEAFVLNYSTASEIEDAISEIISERGRIKSVERTNTVIVTDVATNIYKIGEIIKRLDKRTPQVYIDSKIVKTSTSNIQNLGISWQPQATAYGASRPFTFPFKARGGDGVNSWEAFFPSDPSVVQVSEYDDNGNVTGQDIDIVGLGNLGTMDFTTFQAVMSYLKTLNRTKVISNPRIVTLSNKTAKVQVGREISVPTYEVDESTGQLVISGYETKEVGVVLDVTPHVNDANEILVELKPEVSAKETANASYGNVETPIFSITKAETQVLIKDRETIAIGGLMKDQKVTTTRKVPILGDMPLVGGLFRSSSEDLSNNEQTETLFFITITIVDTLGNPQYETTA